MSLTEKEQQNQAGIISRYFGQLSALLLDPADTLSLYRAKQIVQLAPGMATMGYVLPEVTAARMVQMMYHLGVIAVQAQISWAGYLFTSMSGLRKIKNIMVRNPIYLVTFYLGFYVRALNGVDATLFQSTGSLDDILNRVPFPDSLPFDPAHASTAANIARSLIAGQVIDKEPFASQPISDKLPRAPARGRYILERDAFTYDDTEIQEHMANLMNLRKNVTKVTKQAGLRKKKHIKAAQRKALEIRDEGNITCMDTCKQQVKTASGCVCDSECSPTTWWSNGKPWCYVDPAKCPKRAKHLQKTITGRHYDTCSAGNKTQTNKCFSGTQFIDCERV